MNGKGLDKISSKDSLKLEPIIYDKELSAFVMSNKIDIFATTIELDDDKQRDYKFTVWLPSKAYGDMEINFKYTGVNRSDMTVKTPNMIYKFEFDANLFQEHVIKLLRIHIKKWKDEKIGFFGMIEEAVNFYNDVLEHPNTVAGIDEVIADKNC